MDDVEDNSHLRRGLPGAVQPLAIWGSHFCARTDFDFLAAAHKIYGVPQTINSANYVYFLAIEELRKGNFKIEEAITSKYTYW